MSLAMSQVVATVTLLLAMYACSIALGLLELVVIANSLPAVPTVRLRDRSTDCVAVREWVRLDLLVSAG